MTRLNKILLGLLGVQLLLALVTFGADDGARIARLEAIARDIDPGQVTKVAIFDRRDRDATGEAKPAVELAKVGDGWTLASHHGYPAEPSKVSDLLADLAAMKARGPMTTSASRHVQLGVADDVYERRVVVTTADGERVFYVGQSAGGRRTAVRRAGDGKVYAVGGLSAYSIGATPRSWVSPTYVSIPKDDVAAIAVTTAKGTTTIERTGDTWTLAGQAVDATKVDGLLGKLANLSVAEPADPARDASAPTATITVRFAPPTPEGGAGDAGVAASVAAPERVLDVIADGERYWVRERGNPHAVLVDAHALRELVELSRDALVSKEAHGATTPTPPTPPTPRDTPG